MAETFRCPWNLIAAPNHGALIPREPIFTWPQFQLAARKLASRVWGGRENYSAAEIALMKTRAGLYYQRLWIAENEAARALVVALRKIEQGEIRAHRQRGCGGPNPPI
jgi:hypothetical protein